jgi:hypothetical protein
MSLTAKCTLCARRNLALFVVALAGFDGFSAANNAFRHFIK